MAADVPYLFERMPDWTQQNILPLFELSHPEAGAAWAARKYSRHIGSPRLFELTKPSLLALFGRSDVAAEDIAKFAEWLASIIITNLKRGANVYALTPIEAKAALRRAGAGALPSVGHLIALEMERAKPEEKVTCWRSVVQPALEGIWPLDVELQSRLGTFKLVQTLLATGNAFPQAAEVIIPLLQTNDPQSHSTVFSIAQAPQALYATGPEQMLKLVSAIVGDVGSRSVFSLRKVLDRIRDVQPSLSASRKFQKLSAQAAD
jgi:hypothetical protein